MIIINNKSYSYSGFSWCDKCDDTVCNGIDTGNKYLICINGHKTFYGKNLFINTFTCFLI